MGLLDGRTVFISGAARGIGRAMARRFAVEGAKLVLAASVGEHLQALADELAADGRPRPLLLGYDVRDRAAAKTAFQAIRQAHGHLDVAVNNAGILASGLLGMIPAEQIDAVLATNLTAVVDHLQLESRLMRGAGGSIINLSSFVGVAGRAGMGVYSASKAGLLGLTRSAAKELGPRGIRVNALAPGFIDTDMNTGLSAEQRGRWLAGIPLQRAGTAEEVASAALFLASSLSSYVSGQVLGVDGCLLE
jgi:3-oxoacyl-[acyl-carrier protein] reductase